MGRQRGAVVHPSGPAPGAGADRRRRSHRASGARGARGGFDVDATVDADVAMPDRAPSLVAAKRQDRSTDHPREWVRTDTRGEGSGINGKESRKERTTAETNSGRYFRMAELMILVAAVATITRVAVWLAKEMYKIYKTDGAKRARRKAVLTIQKMHGKRKKARHRGGTDLKVTPETEPRWHAVIARPKDAGGYIKSWYLKDTYSENHEFMIGKIWSGPKGDTDIAVRITKGMLLTRGVSHSDIEKRITFEIGTFGRKEDVPKEPEVVIIEQVGNTRQEDRTK